MGREWIWWLAFTVFNAPIAAFLTSIPFGKRLDKVLKGKAPDSSASDATSYSSIVGAIGAIVLVSFFWVLGNLVLSLVPEDITKVKPLLGTMNPFFLIGSALFLPYAFNQLKTLFPWGANASVAMAQISQNAALALSFRSSHLPHAIRVSLSPSSTRQRHRRRACRGTCR